MPQTTTKTATISRVWLEMGQTATIGQVRNHLARLGIEASSTFVGKVKRKTFPEAPPKGAERNGTSQGRQPTVTDAMLNDGPWDETAGDVACQPLPLPLVAATPSLDVAGVILDVRKLLAILGSKDALQRVIAAL